MNIETTPIKDLLIINPSVYNDERGYFYESYNQNKFKIRVSHLKLKIYENRKRSQRNV